MQTLQLNSSGADVVRLQEKLKALGFNPGKIDGDFGTATEAAGTPAALAPLAAVLRRPLRPDEDAAHRQRLAVVAKRSGGNVLWERVD